MTSTAPRATGADAWWRGASAPRSLADLLVHHAETDPDLRLFSRREGSSWVPVTAAVPRPAAIDWIRPIGPAFPKNW